MAMSKRSGGEKQEDIWIAHTELAVPPGHPFYTRLNDLLEGASFDHAGHREMAMAAYIIGMQKIASFASPKRSC